MGRHSNDSFQLHGIINGVSQSAALTFRCIGNLRHVPGITVIGPESGAPYSEVKFVGERKPEILTSLMALESLLDNVSLLGTNCITSDGSHPGVRAFMRSHNPCAPNGTTAGSSHRRITVAKAHLLVTALGGAVGKSASAQVRVIELSTDGDAEPHVIVNNAALPSTFISEEEFVIAAPTLESIPVAAENIIDWQLDTGIEATVIVPANSIFPVTIDITKVLPKFKINHNDPQLLASDKIPDDGLECTHANTLFALRKRSPFGGLVALASTEHIKITAAGYAYHETHYDASGSAVGTGTITLECNEGVGGVPLVVTTGQALS